MPIKTVEIKHIISSYPDINFEIGPRHSWNFHHRTIIYIDNNSAESIYGLLHEISHALLDHRDFKHDIQLLKMERDAWAKAIEIAKRKFDIDLDREYAEDCLDSYRDWLYKRSVCPQCRLVGFQVDKNAYSCPHCLIDWKVPASRLCSVKRKILV